MSQILKQLKEYFAKTPKEQIDKDWQEIEAMGLQGMTICEFIENQKKHDIMETKQMTNEQKAVKIATYDKWVLHEVESVDGSLLYNSGKNELQKGSWLLSAYLNDLNYLVPVAIKVMQKLDIIDYDAEDLRYNILGRLSYLELNNYQPLFDAVFDGIVYLKNQETNEQHRL